MLKINIKMLFQQRHQIVEMKAETKMNIESPSNKPEKCVKW